MKNPYKVIIAVLIVFGLFFVMYNVYIWFNDSVKTHVATEGRLRIEVPAEGYIIKDENVLFESENRIVSSFVADGERVSKGSLVAMIYNTDVDSETRSKLKNLNEKITNLEKLMENSGSSAVNDGHKLDELAKSKINDIISYASRGEGNKLLTVKAELENVVDSKIASDKRSANSVLANLKEEKQEIENGIEGEKTPLYSNKSGLYFSKLDGFENVISVKDITALTPSGLGEAGKQIKDKSGFNGSYAKISDVSWYYAAAVDTNKIAGVKVGKTVKLRIKEQGSTMIDAVVYYISDDSDGKSVIVIKGDTYNEYIYYNSVAEADIVLNTASGIMVPKNAIKVVDNITGIYVKKSTGYVFKQVEILASDDKNVIIKEPDKQNEHSLLYEEVVIRGEVKIK